MKTKHPAIYLKTKYHDKFNLSDFPNAGPRPNITGMRNLYWGKDAYIVKCGVYAYLVDKDTYKRIKSYIRKEGK